jgi:integrase
MKPTTKTIVNVTRRPGSPMLQLRWKDPQTGSERRRSAGTADPREAERAAILLEQDLLQRHAGYSTSWEIFKERVMSEYYPNIAASTVESYAAAINAFETHVGAVREMDSIDAGTISRYTAGLRKAKLAEATVANRLRHLKALLRWATRLKLLRECPPFVMPRMAGRRLAKGRAITETEFEAMRRAIPEVLGSQHAGEYADCWDRFLIGLWLSGLRIEEARELQWDKGFIRLDFTPGQVPRMIFKAEGQKNRKDETIPITREFAAFLSTTPDEDRRGLVFPLKHPVRQINRTWVVKMVSSFGEHAKIEVNEQGKFASAHDLRRAFGTRLARQGIKPITLKALMRHSSITTTLSYYVDNDVDDLAADLWGDTKAPAKPLTKST